MRKLVLALSLLAFPALAQAPQLPLEAQLALARTAVADTLQRLAGTIMVQSQEIEALKAQLAALKAERDASKTEPAK